MIEWSTTFVYSQMIAHYSCMSMTTPYCQHASLWKNGFFSVGITFFLQHIYDFHRKLELVQVNIWTIVTSRSRSSRYLLRKMDIHSTDIKTIFIHLLICYLPGNFEKCKQRVSEYHQIDKKILCLFESPYELFRSTPLWQQMYSILL